MIVQLSGLEITDTGKPPGEWGLEGLLSGASALINLSFRQGRKTSDIAKYFLRALARQEMIMALTHCRRPRIRTEMWRDEGSLFLSDRFMGCTTTLMPLLEELCGLGEDMGRGLEVRQGFVMGDDSTFPGGSTMDRALDLRIRLENWRPSITSNVPLEMAPTLLSQASALRLSVLLYLHRLIYPAGSVSEHDQKATTIGRRVIATLGVVPDRLRTTLWPAFVAACEMLDAEDRTTALAVFDGIYASRSTPTALRVKEFCLRRIWQARDSGQDWDWMKLIYRYPGECVPI